jgi:hypothetical protein
MRHGHRWLVLGFFFQNLSHVRGLDQVISPIQPVCSRWLPMFSIFRYHSLAVCHCNVICFLFFSKPRAGTAGHVGAGHTTLGNLGAVFRIRVITDALTQPIRLMAPISGSKNRRPVLFLLFFSIHCWHETFLSTVKFK